MLTPDDLKSMLEMARIARKRLRYGILISYKTGAIVKAYAKLSAQVLTLFDAIKHGDEEHQKWLKEKIEEHFK